ncbi:MAG: PHP domain-containing protein [Candidatus Saganbacteria bacterium]|nr:PHP domain-containing protein [Candidatus Saganbacteria bacterium]
MPADLHIHTTYSDGTYLPVEIIKKAKEVELSAVAITDHDEVAGIEEAQAEGLKEGIKVVPGVELTTELPNTEVHILGYFLDYKSEKLNKMLDKIRASRTERVFRICKKLNEVGVKIDPEEVFKLAGKGAVGRPHVARVLIAKGIVSTTKEAFVKYLVPGTPGYEKHYKLSPEEAIGLIGEVGGVPVFAHPAVSHCDELIPQFMSYGLKGLEVYYPTHNQQTENRYLALAEKYKLLITGGTDFHGGGGFNEMVLGTKFISDKQLALLEAEKNG